MQEAISICRRGGKGYVVLHLGDEESIYRRLHGWALMFKFDKRWYLHVWVKRQHRRRGIGSELCQALLAGTSTIRKHKKPIVSPDDIAGKKMFGKYDVEMT